MRYTRRLGSIILAGAIIVGSITVFAGWVPSWTLGAGAIVVIGAAIVSEARTEGIGGVSLALWLLLVLMVFIAVDEAFPELLPSIVSIAIPLAVLVALLVLHFHESDGTLTAGTNEK